MLTCVWREIEIEKRESKDILLYPSGQEHSNSQGEGEYPLSEGVRLGDGHSRGGCSFLLPVPSFLPSALSSNQRTFPFFRLHISRIFYFFFFFFSSIFLHSFHFLLPPPFPPSSSSFSTSPLFLLLSLSSPFSPLPLPRPLLFSSLRSLNRQSPLFTPPLLGSFPRLTTS